MSLDPNNSNNQNNVNNKNNINNKNNNIMSDSNESSIININLNYFNALIQDAIKIKSTISSSIIYPILNIIFRWNNDECQINNYSFIEQIEKFLINLNIRLDLIKDYLNSKYFPLRNSISPILEKNTLEIDVPYAQEKYLTLYIKEYNFDKYRDPNKHLYLRILIISDNKIAPENINGFMRLFYFEFLEQIIIKGQYKNKDNYDKITKLTNRFYDNYRYLLHSYQFKNIQLKQNKLEKWNKLLANKQKESKLKISISELLTLMDKLNL
ncbi:MAG: hypothetical protein ACTSRZ_08320 [Promethearchaeota archaeon]